MPPSFTGFPAATEWLWEAFQLSHNLKLQFSLNLEVVTTRIFIQECDCVNAIII